MVGIWHVRVNLALKTEESKLNELLLLLISNVASTRTANPHEMIVHNGKRKAKPRICK